MAACSELCCLQYTMKSLALILGLLAAVQAVPAKGPKPLDVYMPVIEGAPVPIPPKIGGGQPATLGQFPHQAAIVIGDTSFCGGSLIARDWILTAAQCTAATSFQVILGRIQWQGTGGVSVVTTESIVHEYYNSATLAYNIALLRLPTPVTLTSTIQPVALTTPDDASNEFAGVTALVSGFIKEKWTGVVGPDLMWVELLTLTNFQCVQIYGFISIRAFVICAVGGGYGSDCIGDIGDPLVITRNGGFTQIGVVSLVSGFCAEGYPTVYTRVTTVRDWIQQNSGV